MGWKCEDWTAFCEESDTNSEMVRAACPLSCGLCTPGNVTVRNCTIV